jgi:hypothetical protein
LLRFEELSTWYDDTMGQMREQGMSEESAENYQGWKLGARSPEMEKASKKKQFP